MKDAAGKFSATKDEPIASLLKLLAKELVLLESSDWQFLISTWSARDYAEMRFTNHHSDFTFIHGLINRVSTGGMLSDGEKARISDIVERDRLFEDINPEWWAKIEFPQ